MAPVRGPDPTRTGMTYLPRTMARTTDVRLHSVLRCDMMRGLRDAGIGMSLRAKGGSITKNPPVAKLLESA